MSYRLVQAGWIVHTRQDGTGKFAYIYNHHILKYLSLFPIYLSLAVSNIFITVVSVGKPNYFYDIVIIVIVLLI